MENGVAGETRKQNSDIFDADDGGNLTFRSRQGRYWNSLPIAPCFAKRIKMDSENKSLTKKRGRPTGVKHAEFVGLRLPIDAVQQIDAWITAQPEPRPSRSGAIRRLLAEALGNADKPATFAQMTTDMGAVRRLVASVSDNVEDASAGSAEARAAYNDAVAQLAASPSLKQLFWSWVNAQVGVLMRANRIRHNRAGARNAETGNLNASNKD